MCARAGATPPFVSHWFFGASFSLKRRFYACLGDVGELVFATYCLNSSKLAVR